MSVRPRALVLLLPLTVGDYLLWNWSVAASHDVLALVSGMTLLPLAALSLGLLGIAALRVLARSLRESSTITRSVHPANETPAEDPSANAAASQASRSPSSKDRLAA
jgi:hypothetical protein